MNSRHEERVGIYLIKGFQYKGLNVETCWCPNFIIEVLIKKGIKPEIEYFIECKK